MMKLFDRYWWCWKSPGSYALNDVTCLSWFWGWLGLVPSRPADLYGSLSYFRVFAWALKRVIKTYDCSETTALSINPSFLFSYGLYWDTYSTPWSFVGENEHAAGLGLVFFLLERRIGDLNHVVSRFSPFLINEPYITRWISYFAFGWACSSGLTSCLSNIIYPSL